MKSYPMTPLTGPTNPKDVDSRYMIPVVDRLFGYLPKSFRRIFWCGVDQSGIAEDKEGRYVTKKQVYDWEQSCQHLHR